MEALREFNDTPKQEVTVLESQFARDIELQSYKSQSQSAAFTNTIRDLLTYASGNNEILFEDAVVAIQCELLKHKHIKLATSFQMYQPSNGWSTYIRGRLCLLRNEYTEAAVYFQKAAVPMSRPSRSLIGYTTKSKDFLDPTTSALLSNGLASYYLHITNLFSAVRIHARAAYFAQIALQYCNATSSPEQYSDLLSRLFHAALATNSYPVAYSALVRYTDRALQRSALASLITAMAADSAIEDFLSFPFPTLQKEVDAWLVEKARYEALTPERPGVTPFFKILYAWRLRQGDFRGAAAVLVERLEAKKSSGWSKGGMAKTTMQKTSDAALAEYVVGINALALVGGEEDGWVFVDGSEGKRKVVRLADLREEYSREMDRVGMLEMGRFGIVGDDDGEEDVEMG